MLDVRRDNLGAAGLRLAPAVRNECGTRMTVKPDVLVKLKVQAASAVAEIERLIATPDPKIGHG
jgi:hypothetical protein